MQAEPTEPVTGIVSVGIFFPVEETGGGRLETGGRFIEHKTKSKEENVLDFRRIVESCGFARLINDILVIN
jgi:hypothetical protein